MSVPASRSIANTQRFHTGRIPFSIIEHWAFKGFVKALSPSYEKSLFKRNALSRTHLDEVYKDTVEMTDAILEQIPGKETIIVDGFKDRNGRHVINISKAKVGFASYLKTSWFGQRTHKGATYAAEVEKCITPKTLAVCADNTSTNTGQIKGMFGILGRKFSLLFFIGCCVHTMDLVCEGWAKIEQLATIIKKVKDAMQFVRRHSILHEEFRELQKQRHLTDRSASMRGLREFPDTRFAYAYIMIVICWDNWSVLLQVVESEAYKLLKKQKGRKQPAAFREFEDLLSGSSFKRDLASAKLVFSYASITLHKLEGDRQLSSIVLPAYCIFNDCVSRIKDEPDMTLTAETITEIQNEVLTRWTGDGSKVGLRHELHCLAFDLDFYLHCLICHALGTQMFVAIKRSYTDENVVNALATYCGGSDKETYLSFMNVLTELKGRSGPFVMMCRILDAKAKKVVVELQRDQAFVEASPIEKFFCLVEKGKALDITLTNYQAIRNDMSKDENAQKFAKMAVEVLSIITHACQVERINKNHGMVHSKARAALGNSNTTKLLSIFTNQELKRKFETPTPRVYTLDSLLPKSPIGDDDDDVLAKIQHLDITTYLPAEPSTEESSEDEDEEMEEPESDVLTFDSFQVPSSFTLITEAAFLSAAVVAAGGVYVLQYWDNSTWNLGVIKKYKPRARIYNFDVNWEGDDVRSQQLKLDMYYDGTSDPKSGNWVYLKRGVAHPRPVEATTDAPPAQRART